MKLVYKCDFCPKFFDTKEKAEDHEATCFSNPENKGCGSCHWSRSEDVWGNMGCAHKISGYPCKTMCEKYYPFQRGFVF